MEHYILNTDKDIILKVSEHVIFYSNIGTSVTGKYIKRIGLGKSEYDKVLKFLKEKEPTTVDIELFFMKNFPIMKCSIYNNRASFTYYNGVNTRNAIDMVLEFCSIHKTSIIEIYNSAKNKNIIIKWEDLMEDDSFVRSRLGNVMGHYFINSKTGKELKVAEHERFMKDVFRNPELFKKIDLNPELSVVHKKQKYFEDYFWLMKIAPLIRVTSYGNTVFEYDVKANDKNAVIRSVYDFCIDHNYKDNDIIFIATTKNTGTRQTIKDFMKDYFTGNVKISNIIKKIIAKLTSI